MRPTSAHQMLSQAGTASFLISNLTNIRYLTGLELSFGLVLITKGKMLLLADGRYIEMAKKKVARGITVTDFDRLETIMKAIRQCGFEADDVTVARLKGLKKKCPKTTFVPKRGVIEEFRRSKDAAEQRLFRRAQSITDELLRRVPSQLRTGITEKELAWKLRQWAFDLGADELSFDPVVAFGTHSAHPHHHPTNRKLKKGHIVQIDVGAKYGGFHGDQSEVYFTAKPTELQQRVYDAVYEAKEAVIKEMFCGADNRDLDTIALEVLEEHGFGDYPYPHALGHGVGLEVHEGVHLSEHAPKQPLVAGEIIAVEPAVYLPGKFGIRLEEEVIVR